MIMPNILSDLLREELSLFCLTHSTMITDGKFHFETLDECSAALSDMIVGEFLIPTQKDLETNGYGQEYTVLEFSCPIYGIEIVEDGTSVKANDPTDHFLLYADLERLAKEDTETSYPKIVELFDRYRPMTEEGVLIHSVVNGPFIFNSYRSFLRAIPWLLEQQILSLDPDPVFMPAHLVNVNGHDKISFDIKRGNKVGYQSGTSTTEYEKNIYVKIADLTCGRRRVLEHLDEVKPNYLAMAGRLKIGATT